MLLSLVLLLLLLCVSCVGASSLGYKNGSNEVIRCREKERQALLTFKAGLEWGLLPWWNNKDCCNWSGVVCSDQTGHVTDLAPFSVSIYGLAGKPSPSLLDLPELSYMDLTSIDFQNRPFPKFFGSFTKLKHLDLYNCNFSGIIPSQLGNLSNLNYLDLRSNSENGGNLSVGNIDWLSRLSSLETLYMDGIDLSRATNWVDIINSLPFLSFLSLSNCRLSKVISPSSINTSSSSTTSIKELYLESNGFTSSSWLFNLSSSSLVRLSLSGNMLENPDFGGYMPSLEDLDLSYNLLQGMIPNSFGNLSSLIVLNMQFNQLNETITKNLGTLSNLWYLDLSSNSLTSILSEAHFSNLSRLAHLDLSGNALHIKVSPQWSPCFQLEFLGLRSCNLGPLFPNWIQTQKDINYLDLSNTGILENIPSWFWNISSQFKYLNLSSNNIGGTLPHLSSKISSYYPAIDLSSNNFVGPIPLLPSTSESINLSMNKFVGTISFLCQLQEGALSFLDISHNSLTGGLHCLARHKKLIVINLAHNGLSGKLPSFGSYYWLETLNMYNNSFSGKLPMSLSNSRKLSFLDVGENNLTGNVPSWIGRNLSQLRILSLRSNKFSGSLLLSICELNKLQVLDFSINNLSGAIPSCLSNISAMVQKGVELNPHQYLPLDQYIVGNAVDKSPWYIDYSVIGWQGRQLEFRKNLRLLYLIDLSRNNLSGEIPDEITELFELVALNLSRNALQGKVSEQIGRLKSIETLDLSRNMFSGKLPASLSQLNSLNFLDLSYNNFFGKIPTGTQLQSFDASKFVGNVGLCGPPLPSKCPGDESPPTAVDSEDKEGDNGDDGEFMKWLYIGMASGFVTGFWGICGALLLNRRGRHALFHFTNNLADWFDVKVAASRF